MVEERKKRQVKVRCRGGSHRRVNGEQGKIQRALVSIAYLTLSIPCRQSLDIIRINAQQGRPSR